MNKEIKFTDINNISKNVWPVLFWVSKILTVFLSML